MKKLFFFLLAVFMLSSFSAILIAGSYRVEPDLAGGTIKVFFSGDFTSESIDKAVIDSRLEIMRKFKGYGQVGKAEWDTINGITILTGDGSKTGRDVKVYRVAPVKPAVIDRKPVPSSSSQRSPGKHPDSSPSPQYD